MLKMSPILFTLLAALSVAQECAPALDIVFLIDNTVSMKRHMDNIRGSFPKMLADLEQDFPGSRFGYASFNDKNIQAACLKPGKGNYCYRLEQPLTTITADVNAKVQKYFPSFLDGNLREDLLSALMVTALNTTTGWRDEAPSDTYKRVVVVLTEGTWRLPGSAECKPVGYRDNDGDGDYDCKKEDYPSEEQAIGAVKKNNISVLLFTEYGMRTVYRDFFAKMKIDGIVIDVLSNLLITGTKRFVRELVCGPEVTTEAPTPTTRGTETGSQPGTPAPAGGASSGALGVALAGAFMSFM